MEKEIKQVSFTKLLALSLVSFLILTFTYKHFTYRFAIDNALVTINDLLLNYQAVRTYVSKIQKEEIYRLQREGEIDKEYFSPQILSSTFSAKVVNEFYNIFRENDGKPLIKLRFASDNPRNPDNLATKKESAILKKFNNGAANRYSEVIDTKNGKTLYYAIPTQRTTKECMRCHSDPKLAPKGLIELYGDKNGFYEEANKIRAIISVFYPIEQELNDADKFFYILTSITFAIFSALLFITRKMYRNVEESNAILDDTVKKRTQELKTKTQYVQTILDTSPNLIILATEDEIIDVNKAFLSFFKVNSLDEFSQTYGSMSRFFEDVDEKYFISRSKLNDVPWVRYIMDNNENTYKVKMTIDGETHYYSLKAGIFEKDMEIYLIILSDITEFQLQKFEYKKIASTDNLTQLSNRFQFNILFEQEIKNTQRNDSSLSLIFIDLDHFKNINDTYGHDIGDLVLKEFATVLQDNVRNSDILARWGGEEFILLLPNTPLDKAIEVAEGIRKKIEDYDFNDNGKLTCSLGISTFHQEDNEKTLVKRADEALYKAKSNGRNRVEVIDI